MEPFLTVFTRHMAARPEPFRRCLESLAAQTCKDFEHVVAVDDSQNGRGWRYANGMFEALQDEVHGRYVLSLDDDDTLTPDAVYKLKYTAEEVDPDVIVFRAEHGEFGILPCDDVWAARRPIYARIGGGNVCVRRELWLQCLPAYRTDRYEADYLFLEAIWKTEPLDWWIDEVLTRQPRAGRGRGNG